MGISAGLDAFRLTFELSPVVLTGGVAQFMGGALPIIALTEALNFTNGLLSGGDPLDLDDFFAHFLPVQGSSLIDQAVAKYPFANQAVAANAVIRQPLTISMRMICPARGESGVAVKLATMMALQATLQIHNASGGTYTIATPAFFYTNCLMTGMRDTSASDSRQLQNTYQLDFEQPLLTITDAEQAQNNLISLITNGTPVSFPPSLSGFSLLPPSLSGIGVLPISSGPGGGMNIDSIPSGLGPLPG
jgi:hypothetical protein